MSARIVNKIACRTYAILFGVVGVLVVIGGAGLLYLGIAGFPPTVAPETLAKIDMDAFKKFAPAAGAFSLIVGLVVAALGILAWFRFVSAIAGLFVLWAVLCAGDFTNPGGSLGGHVFWGITTILLAVGLIAAIMTRRAPYTVQPAA
jgi:hypothetical protein